MSTLTLPAERIAAAGRSRADVCSSGAASVAGSAGTAAFVGAAFRGWGSNPAPVMPAPKVATTKRHQLTPAPRPEEASP